MILEAVSSNKKSLILIDFIGVSALLPTHIHMYLPTHLCEMRITEPFFGCCSSCCPIIDIFLL